MDTEVGFTVQQAFFTHIYEKMEVSQEVGSDYGVSDFSDDEYPSKSTTQS